MTKPVRQKPASLKPFQITILTEGNTNQNPLNRPGRRPTFVFGYGLFSQAILQDTELLCTGTVKDTSFVYDDSGRAVGVSYPAFFKPDSLRASYIAQTDQITVNSPIVRAEGDEAWLLYQMEPGKPICFLLKNRRKLGVALSFCPADSAYGQAGLSLSFRLHQPD